LKSKIVKLGGLDALILLLCTKPKDSPIQRGVSMALANLTNSSEEISKILLKEKQALSHIVQLGNQSQDVDVQWSVVVLLNNLASVASFELNKYPEVTELLQKFSTSKDLDIRGESNQALAEMGNFANLGGEVADLPSSPMTFMKSYSMDSGELIRDISNSHLPKICQVSSEDEIQILLTACSKKTGPQALKELSEMSTNSENCKKIITLGGIRIMSVLLGILTESTLYILRILKQILSENESQAFPIQEIFPKLLPLLKKDIEVQIHIPVMEIIFAVAKNNTKNQIALVKSIPLMLNILKKSEYTEEKYKAVKALGSLASSNNRKVQQLMRKYGAITVIGSCLKIVPLQRAAAATLQNIADNDPMNQDAMRKGDVFESLAAIFQGDDEDLIAVCCLAGRTFIKGPNVKNQNRFRNIGILTSLTSMLMAKSKGLLPYVTSLLLELARDNSKNQDMIFLNVGVHPLISLLETSGSPPVLYSIIGIVYSSKSKKHKIAFRDGKAVDALTPLMKHEDERIRTVAWWTIEALLEA